MKSTDVLNNEIQNLKSENERLRELLDESTNVLRLAHVKLWVDDIQDEEPGISIGNQIAKNTAGKKVCPECKGRGSLHICRNV